MWQYIQIRVVPMGVSRFDILFSKNSKIEIHFLGKVRYSVSYMLKNSCHYNSSFDINVFLRLRI